MTLTKATYSMIEGATVNVLDYGADKTGVTDSTAAIQAAINAANSAGGGCVYFPSGVYTIGTTTYLTLQSNVSLMGDGPSSQLKLADNTPISPSLAALVAINETNILIENLYFDGNRANQALLVGLFRVQNCSKVLIRGNWLVDCNNVGVYFTNTCSFCAANGNIIIDCNGTNLKIGTDCADMMIDGNLMYDTGAFATHYDGFIMSRFGVNRRLTFSNNVISSPAGGTIGMGVWLLCGEDVNIYGNTFNLPDVPSLQVDAESAMKDITFANNTCTGAPVAIVDKTPGFNVTGFNISSNTFTANNQTAISAAPSFAGVFSGFVINSNVITATMNSTSDKGILVTVKDTVISNNTISMTGSAAGDGISNNAENVAISGNVINMDAVGSRGIVSTADYVSAIGNTVIGTTSYGIRMSSPANYCNVSVNTLRNCSLGILNGGANSVTANNIT
jgi:hypothetical protein